MSSERRQHPRQKVAAGIRLTLICDSSPGGENPAGSVNAEVVDISSSGVGLIIAAEIEPGTLLRFVEKDMDWPYPDRGVVMWTAQSAAGLGTRAGIRFL